MRGRIVLEVIFTILYIGILSYIIYYMRWYLLSPIVLLLFINTFKIRFVFYSDFDYSSRLRYKFYKEYCCLFPIYVFEDEETGEKYIDDGDYFNKSRDYSNITLKYLYTDGDYVYLNAGNTRNRKLIKLINFVTIICCITQITLLFMERSTDTDFIRALFITLALGLVSIILLNNVTLGKSNKFSKNLILLDQPILNGSIIESLKQKVDYSSKTHIETSVSGITLWFNNVATIFVPTRKISGKMIDRTFNINYESFVKTKFMEAFE